MRPSNTGFTTRAAGVAFAAIVPFLAACGATENGPEPSTLEPTTATATASQALAGPPFCWLDSYGRGVGTIPNACPPGQQYDAGLCYQPCQPGYYNVGPVCWQSCPSGYTDDGAFCRKDANIFGA